MNFLVSGRTTALALFLILGAQIGVWSALLPQLAEDNGFTPGDIGLRLMILAAASTVTVLVAGKLTDRWGRRFSAVAGLALLSAAFLSLAWTDLVSGYGLAVFVLLGAATGLLDIAANAVGSDYEREAGEKKMVGLHAAFSAGAALAAAASAAALSVAGNNQTIFVVAGLLIPLPLALVCFSRFPEHRNRAGRGASAGVVPALSFNNPLILILICVGTVCFLGDGILQGFGPLYIRDSVGTSAAVSALGVALFHGASFLGRTIAQPIAHRIGNEANLIVFCTLSSAAGVVIVVLASNAVWALAGMAVVGLLLSPVIPTVYSLIGRAAGQQSGAAMSVLTASSYAAFTFGPGIAGYISQAWSLKIALIVVICGYTLCGALAAIARRPILNMPTPDPQAKLHHELHQL